MAIAITLIVLPLVDSARELDGRPAVSFLRENHTALIAAAISFAVIGGYWRAHHRLFSRAEGYTRSVMQANLYWLAGIMAVPVVTVLFVSGSGRDRLGLGLYLGVILAVRILLMTEELLLAGAGLLGAERLGRRVVLRHVIPAGLIVVALVTAMIHPAWSMWPVVVLALERPLGVLLDVRGSGRAPAGDATT
ncbi:hypothetical protein GCM10011575_19380 [Microlunatus endophyticus]|uniref:DUF1211 domain-containing protein n=1 Tax=Microlunatus endophyticus TaxID=1716077 RepID=A0A917W2M7_9ACTN|nr:hypothetical protein GCM10011575_19380 [Microlunatus endophyticus]